MSKWKQLREGLQTLKNATRTSKNPEIIRCIKNWTQVASILESSDIPPESCSLKGSTTSLLEDFLVPTLRCCAILLDGIFQEKIVSAADTIPWEGFLNSLIWEILDHLEGNSPDIDKIRSVVAEFLYPSLCQNCFPSDLEAWRPSGISLLCSIHILLSETVIDNIDNQRKLRDAKLLGGKRIGFALSSSREYLCIDTLLDLIVNLAPAAASKNDKRGPFLDTVFDASLFPSHNQLKKAINKASESGWEAVSKEIARILSQTDVSLPQPFKIIKVTLDGEAYSSMHHLYVSSKGLTSNIEEDGKIETFYVHYSTIIKARFKTPLDSASETTVTLDLTSPPTIGLSQLDKPALGPPATLVIVIYRDDRENFTRCLKARGLGKVMDRGERKLSKLDEELSLGFPTSSQTFPEKARKVFDDLDDSSDNFNSAVELPFTLKIPDANSVSKPELNSASVGNHPVGTQRQSQSVMKDIPTSEHPREESKEDDSPNQKSLKRQYADNDEPAECHDRQNKRPRTRPRNHSVGKTVSVHFKSPAAVKKKYGNKGRSSSPQLQPNSDADSFSSPPKPNVKPAGRIAAMKGRGGKKVSTAAKAGKGVSTSKEKEKTRLGKEKVTHDDKQTDDFVPVEASSGFRRSARSRKDNVQKVEKTDDDLSEIEEDEIVEKIETKKHGQKQPTTKEIKNDKKPRKAPWEEAEFIKKINLKNDDTTNHTPVKPSAGEPDHVTPSSPIQQGNILGADNLEEVDLAQAMVPSADTGVDLATNVVPSTEMSYEEIYEDYVVATKDGILDEPIQDVHPGGNTPAMHDMTDHIMNEPQHEHIPQKQQSIPQSVLNTTQPVREAATRTINVPDSPQIPPASPAQIEFDMPIPKRLPVLTEKPVTAIEVKKTPMNTPTNLANTHEQPQISVLHRKPNNTQVESRIGDMPMPANRFEKLPLRNVATKPPTKLPGADSGRMIASDLSSKRTSAQISTPSGSKLPTRRHQELLVRSPLVGNRTKARYSCRNEEVSYRKKERQTMDIVEVLNEIQQVIINKVSNRFDEVRKEVRAGRDNILRAAAEDIEQMRLESVTLFNNMVDLEVEYDSYIRKIEGGLVGLNMVNSEIEAGMKEMIGEQRMTIGKVKLGAIPASCLH